MILLTHDQLVIHYKSQLTPMEACHEPGAAHCAIVQFNILSEYSILHLPLNIVRSLAYPFSSFANILNLKPVFHFTDSLFQLQIGCKFNKHIITVS